LSEIPELERLCDFPKVDELFEMIDDEGTPLIAPYGPKWLEVVKGCRSNPSNLAFRRLQPYTVSVRRNFLDTLQATGCLMPLLADSDSAWVVFKDHDALYSGRFGFGANGAEESAFLEA
jgi:hypothetical protein